MSALREAWEINSSVSSPAAEDRVGDVLPRAIRVAGAQVPNVVGDITGNRDRILAAMRWAEGEDADVLVLPELALTGYPLEDLVLHREFVTEARAALLDLARHAGSTTTVVGTVDPVPPRRSWDTRDRAVAIGAALIADGEIRGMYHKVFLPTYEIFDEARNFAPGSSPGALWRIGDVVAGVSICEDLWSGDGPPEEQSAGGAQVLLVPNASPYHRGKPSGRLRLAASVARRNGVPVVYVNFCGGQDELVFDGGSLIVDADGTLRYRAAAFAEERFVVDVPVAPARPVGGPLTSVHTRPLRRRAATPTPTPASPPREAEMVWQALVTGTRDFALKNDFHAAVLGLSGGIDAAVAAAVAADALGAANVLGIAMPADDTPSHELEDAKALATSLGIDFGTVRLADLRDLVTDGLGDLLDTRTAPDTRRSFEARLRTTLLATIADEQARVLLATGNKSELSIGVAASYGDLAGDFAPLKDCPKTLLYDLAEHRNRAGEVIPARILDKRTTAEQSGTELPASYEVLDAVVERYVEDRYGLEDLIAAGFDPRTTLEILRLVDDAELKRRQIPPGVRISAGAFDQDRRVPLSNAWRPHRSSPPATRSRFERAAEASAATPQGGEASAEAAPQGG